MKSSRAIGKRSLAAKPRNGGTWTEARFKSFIMSALRRAQWPQKYKAIARAYVKDGVNPKTGKPCKLHKCPVCEKLYPKGMMQADHVQPVVPVSGFDSWDGVIARLYCEEEHFQPICRACHKAKSLEENKQRRENKKLNDQA